MKSLCAAGILQNAHRAGLFGHLPEMPILQAYDEASLQLQLTFPSRTWGTTRLTLWTSFPLFLLSVLFGLHLLLLFLFLHLNLRLGRLLPLLFLTSLFRFLSPLSLSAPPLLSWALSLLFLFSYVAKKVFHSRLQRLTYGPSARSYNNNNDNNLKRTDE